MDRKKIAAIVTTYFSRSHADLIVSKFLRGFDTPDGTMEPKVDVVSMYLDQVHPQDVGLKIACLLYTSPSPRDATLSRMPSSA